jgi:hypothetical protein
VPSQPPLDSAGGPFAGLKNKWGLGAQRGRCTLCELGEAMADQIGLERHCPGAARLDRAGAWREAQDPNGTSGTLSGLYVPSA